MWGKFAIIKTQVTELQQLAFFKSDPAGAQTQNLQNRNLTLYSIELRGRAYINTARDSRYYRSITPSCYATLFRASKQVLHPE